MRGRIAGLKGSGGSSSCHDLAMSWMVERIGPEDQFLGLAMHYTAGNPCRNEENDMGRSVVGGGVKPEKRRR
jgi:hypothetical protein